MAMLERNIFKDIVDRKIPADIIFEDDLCLAFRDLHPQAPTHVLIIPKVEVRTHQQLTEADQAVMGRLHWAAVQIAGQLNLTDYRLVINCGEGAGQSVPHLHMHLLAGRSLSWPPG